MSAAITAILVTLKSCYWIERAPVETTPWVPQDCPMPMRSPTSISLLSRQNQSQGVLCAYPAPMELASLGPLQVGSGPFQLADGLPWLQGPYSEKRGDHDSSWQCGLLAPSWAS